MKESRKMNIKRIVIILGILIIPLMYSYFYLSAFWDPYSKLGNLPVAIVNKDEGAIINSVKRNIGQELKDKTSESKELKFCFVTEEEAYRGLTNGKYYATIVIPEAFSKDISTASQKDKTSATLLYSPNETTNYLATQILNKAILQLSDGVKSKVSGEVVDSLSTKLKEVPEKLSEINDGVTELYNGSHLLGNGTTSLMDGSSVLNSNYKTFDRAIFTLKSGVTNIDQGSKSLDNGVVSAITGATTLKNSTKDLYKIDESVKALNAGTTNLNNASNLYVNGVTQYVVQSGDIAQKLEEYVTNNPSAMLDPNMQYVMNILGDANTESQVSGLLSGGVDLKTGTKSIDDNMALLSKSTTDLYKLDIGASSIVDGLTKLKIGSSNLSSGTGKLQVGITQLAAASGDVMTGINSVNVGANKLNEGANKIESGLKEANDQISQGINNTNVELQNLNGIKEFVQEPIKVKQESISIVPNYGTAFASYFMSLSLWVGGIIIFVGIYLDVDEKFKILSRHSKRKGLRTFTYMLIGIAQAVLLAVALQSALHLVVINNPMYYLACVLVSVVFISIIQFFMINFKDAGKFIVILLLILQLTSCGGTFPMELVPKFFNDLYAFMPMTYSVNLFKETISGGNISVMMKNIEVLSGILIAFTTMTIIAGKIRKNYEENN